MKINIDEIVAWLQTVAHEGNHLRLDSREVQPGDVFVAIKGQKTDGRTFIPVAVARGAAAVLMQSEVSSSNIPTGNGVPTLSVPDLNRHLGVISARFYHDPTRHMRGIAVTGTNGKTTTTHWIAHLLTALGEPCAVLGTVGAHLGAQQFDAPELTTPDAVSLQRLYAQVKAAGARAFAIEASSVGLEQDRMKGSHFEVAVFTNLTRDHLDYHKTMEAYAEAKAKLFAWPSLKAAVINLDDPTSTLMLDSAKRHGAQIWCVSQNRECEAQGHYLVAQNVRLHGDSTLLTLVYQDQTQEVRLPAVGRFNVSNLLEAVASVMALGYSLRDIAPWIQTMPCPPGRMELVLSTDAPMGVVDYSHTPDALEKALQTLREVAQERQGKLWVVFGCGGDRDRGKRPIMGALAKELADYVIVTSDNPRTEDPQAIIKDILQGNEGLKVIADRQEAIRQAILEAKPDDVVLVAGKGHETYQIIGTQKHHFSDVEVIRAAFNDRRIATKQGQ